MKLSALRACLIGAGVVLTSASAARADGLEQVVETHCVSEAGAFLVNAKLISADYYQANASKVQSAFAENGVRELRSLKDQPIVCKIGGHTASLSVADFVGAGETRRRCITEDSGRLVLAIDGTELIDARFPSNCIEPTGWSDIEVNRRWARVCEYNQSGDADIERTCSIKFLDK